LVAGVLITINVGVKYARSSDVEETGSEYLFRGEEMSFLNMFGKNEETRERRLPMPESNDALGVGWRWT